MKTVGLIGGMSWESSAQYYRIMNQHVKSQLGGQHSAKIVMFSVDFAEIEKCQVEGRWADAGEMLKSAARALEAAGADLVVLCTNTMHKLAHEIKASVRIPFLHIAEATAETILTRKIHRVGLLGTRYTMEEDFYKGKLVEMGLEVLVPPAAERQLVHSVIYDELCQGRIEPTSREKLKHIMSGLAQGGAQGIILGCTEISLLVKPEDASVPVFDTTYIHAVKAAEYGLK